MTDEKTPPAAPAPDVATQLLDLLRGAVVAAPPKPQTRPARARSAPPMPDQATATKEDWLAFQDEYAGWVEKATDGDLLAEMAWLPEEGRSFSPAEAWMYHECEKRRRRPTDQQAAAGRKKG